MIVRSKIYILLLLFVMSFTQTNAAEDVFRCLFFLDRLAPAEERASLIEQLSGLGQFTELGGEGEFFAIGANEISSEGINLGYYFLIKKFPEVPEGTDQPFLFLADKEALKLLKDLHGMGVPIVLSEYIRGYRGQVYREGHDVSDYVKYKMNRRGLHSHVPVVGITPHMDRFDAANVYIRVLDQMSGRFSETFARISWLEEKKMLAGFEGDAIRKSLISMRAFGHEMLRLDRAKGQTETQLVREGDEIKEIPFKDFYDERRAFIIRRYREKDLPPVNEILDRVKSKKRGEVSWLHQKVLEILRMGAWGPNGLFPLAAIDEAKPKAEKKP